MKSIGVLPAALLLLSSVTATAQPETRGPDGWLVRRSGDQVIARPPDLRPGEFFIVAVEPNIDIGQRSLREWFSGMIDIEIRKLGEPVQKGPITTRADGSLIARRIVKTSTGVRLTSVLAATRQRDDKVLLAGIVCSASACRAREAEAARWIEKHGLAGIQQAPSPDRAAQPAPSERRARTSKPRPAYQTDPGRGLAPSQIDSVVFRRLVSGRVAPVLLLANGEYCTFLDVPPADMNVAAHKKENPRTWGRWRRRRGKIETLRERDIWIEEPDWGEPLAPARPGEALSGTFSRGHGHGTMSFLEEIAFVPEGRFVRRRTANVALSPSTAGVGGGKDDRGTYRLDGRTIELRYESGAVERKAFHWGRAKKDMIFLDNTLYSLDD
jgi:hypothetical protein